MLVYYIVTSWLSVRLWRLAKESSHPSVENYVCALIAHGKKIPISLRKKNLLTRLVINVNISADTTYNKHLYIRMVYNLFGWIVEIENLLATYKMNFSIASAHDSLSEYCERISWRFECKLSFAVIKQ